MTRSHRPWPWFCGIALLPLLWLWPCVFGSHTFVPFDPAVFPPASLSLDADELARARDGANFDVTEVQAWLLPEMRLVQDEARNGRWPSWNPHARTGAPLHEAGAHGLLYPPHWLWLFGGDPSARIVWLSWISLALAGGFAFALLRKVGLTLGAAAFGAVAFQLSGTMMSNGYYWTRLPALAWLPALILAVIRCAEGDRDSRRATAAVALAFAMPWFAGFPPYAAATALCGIWFAMRVLLERLGTDGSAAARRLLRRLLKAFGFGILLTMPQVLPSFRFFASYGARASGQGFAMAAGARFESYGLLGYLVPDAFGTPQGAADLPAALNPLCYLWGGLTDAAGNAAPPNLNFTEYSISFGATALVLAAYGAVRGRQHFRWTLLLTLGLMFGLALFLPFFALLYHLPIIGYVQPMRWLAPASLFLAWLAAIGFDRLQIVEGRSLRRVALVTLGLAAATWFGTSRPARWHADDPDWPARPIAERFGLSVEQVHEHFRAGSPPDLDRYGVATEQFATAGAHAALWLSLAAIALGAYAALRRTRAGPFVLASLVGLSVAQLGWRGAHWLSGRELVRSTDTEVHAFLRERAAAAKASGGFAVVRGGLGSEWPTQLPPGQLIAPGIRDLNYFTVFDARSAEPFRRLLGEEWCRTGLLRSRGYLQHALPDAVLEHPMLDLLGVRYVLATRPLEHAGSRVGPRLRSPRGEFFVYERPHPMPRAFTVPALRPFLDDDALLAAMADAEARFAEAAFVADDVDITAPAERSDGPPRAVIFTRDDPCVVELDVGAGEHPYLVLTDTLLPGWTAEIDGKPVAIERCNHFMRLVRLPGRACHVRFEHHPPLLWPGFLLAALACLLLIVPRPSSAARRRVETTG